jgi:cell division topological specificity factor
MVLERLEQLFKRNRPSSGEAKERLKLVIAQDRAGLSSESLEAMRQEIVAVLARYVEIDPDETEFSLDTDDGMTALIGNFPIRRVKRQASNTGGATTNPE